MIYTTNNKITNRVDMDRLESISMKTMDQLIKNPGNPSNWEEYSDSLDYTPGLAKDSPDNKTNLCILSYRKILALKNNYDAIDRNIFQDEISSQIIIIPSSDSLDKIILGDNPDFNNPKNIISINRMVKIDYYSGYTILNIKKSDYICNQNHDKAYWRCNTFKIDYGDLKDSDYYILNDKSENIEFYLDNGKNHSDLKTAGSNPVCLNDDLNSLINQDSSTSIIVHENTYNVNSIIVRVPKDFNKEHLKYDYFKEINGRIILKTWYK